MPAQIEEQQVREFLKRAEIRTMKKDLQALREIDALKERDKIAKIKTLEEQRQEQEKKLQIAEKERAELEKAKREKILSENAAQEEMAEKDLRQYATEEELQKIFLFESQRIAFEEKVEEIGKKENTILKPEKDKILGQKGDWQRKLDAIIEKEKKLEEEKKFISQKSQESSFSSQKKGLEQRELDIEKEIQEIEKKRWAVEKEIQNIEGRIKEIDSSSDVSVSERNDLNEKIMGINKSLREIYFGIIERAENRKKQKSEELKASREKAAETRSFEKEKVRRQQWGMSAKKEKFYNEVPRPNRLKVPVKKIPAKKIFDIETEEKRRKQFMQDVEKWAEDIEKLDKKQGADIPQK
jgi:hypothetical protein